MAIWTLLNEYQQKIPMMGRVNTRFTVMAMGTSNYPQIREGTDACTGILVPTPSSTLYISVFDNLIY